MSALTVISERVWRVETLLVHLAALAATAATVGRLMAAARLVAMAVLEAATAARRSAEMVSPEEMAAMVATAAACWGQPRSAAMAAMPVIPERAALAATLLADLAALAATAATVGRLMAAARLVAMAATEFWSVLVTTLLTPASSKGSGRGWSMTAAVRAATAARGSEGVVASA